MDTMWSPWRMQYIESAKADGCILCDKPAENNDAAAYILYRGQWNYIMLNAFPYNPGHLMIVPYRHISDPSELPAAELHEHAEITSRSTGTLREAFNCHGFNIGMNLGLVAGAGIADHVHTHIVPRWNGDTNFMPVIADTKSLPQALEETYAKLVDRFAAWQS
jgi:ATP adenylyltransferase